MIITDNKTNSVGARKVKNAKQSKYKKAEFKTDGEMSQSQEATAASPSSVISNLLFLQEVDQNSQDQNDLQEFSHKAFRALKELQINLIDNNLNKDTIKSLKSIVEDNDLIYKSKELTNIAEQIAIRIEVEIAKFEKNKYNDSK